MSLSPLLYYAMQIIKAYFYRVVEIGFVLLFLPVFVVAQRHGSVVFVRDKKNNTQEVRDLNTDTLVAKYRKIREDYDVYGRKAGDPYIITDTFGRVGALDKFGNMFIPCEYDYIYQFRKGIAIAERDGAKGIINYQNKVLLPFEYDEIVLSRVYYGLTDPKAYNLLANWNVVLVRRGTRWYWRTLQNELLNIVSPPPFDWEGGTFFYNRTKYYIQYFDEADRNFVFYAGKVSFTQARFNFKTLQEWEAYPTIADRDTLTISFPNDTLHVFANNNRFQLMNDTLIVLGNKKEFQLFNANFNPIGDKYDTIIKPLNTNYSDWKLANFSQKNLSDEYGKELFFIVKKQAHYGVMNENGTLIIPLLYDAISRLDSAFFLVKRGDKSGIIDIKGKTWLPTGFADKIERLSPLWLSIVKDQKVGLFHLTFRKIIFQDYQTIANTGDNVLLCHASECALFDKDGLLAYTLSNDTIFKEYLKNEQRTGDIQYDAFLSKRYKIQSRMFEKFPALKTDSFYLHVINENVIQVETPLNKYLIDTNKQELTARYLKKSLQYANTISQVPIPTDVETHKDSLFIYATKRETNTADYEVYYIGKSAAFHQVMRFKAPLNISMMGHNTFGFYQSTKYLANHLHLIDLYKKRIDSTSYSFALQYQRDIERIILANDIALLGALNVAGELVIPFKYDAMRPFCEGLARVRLNWHCGYVDKNGVEPLPLHFDYAEDIKDKRALVFKDGVWLILKL